MLRSFSLADVLLSRSGFSDISSDNRYLAISNMATGVDIYSLDSLTLSRHFPMHMVPENNKVMMVKFLRNDGYVSCGAHEGGVWVWNTTSGQPAQFLAGKGGPMSSLMNASSHRACCQMCLYN
jgi:hypothetical protein